MNRKLKFLLLILLAIVVVLCLATIPYLSKSLPQPKVSLGFQGFTIRGTDAYAVISLKNEGHTRIWPAGRGCLEEEIETKDGWITNSQPPFTTIFLGLSSSSNEIFWVDLPPDTLKWRVTAYYYFYERHNLRIEMFEKVATSRTWSRVPQPFWEGVFWCFGLLPEPSQEYGEISTPLLTNKPPAYLPPGMPSQK